MKQGSAQWHDWRMRGVGASDQVHLHWSAPWSKGWAYLYGVKTGAIQEEIEAPHMQRGLDLEKDARLQYELATGLTFIPQLVQNAEHPHLIASLDCWNEEAKRGAEIKCPNAVDHELARKGGIPEKYIPQLCHQVFVTGAKKWDYVSWNGETLAIVPFVPSVDLVLNIVGAAHKFWDFVQLGIPPNGEFPHPRFDTRIPRVAEQRLLEEAALNLELRDQIAILEKELKESDARILASCALERAKIGGVSIVKKGLSRYVKRG